MGITIAGQTAVFLQSLLLGAVLGCFYDLFRITRIAFLMPALLVLIEDLLFFLFSSIALFGFLLENNDGQIRWFILLGVVLGVLAQAARASTITAARSRDKMRFFISLPPE